MGVSGWQINLSGKAYPVYKMQGAGQASATKIATVTKNECFVEGTVPGTGWEGVDCPVVVCDPNHNMVMGVTKEYIPEYKLSDYASNGTSWVKVSTKVRKVVKPTVAYYASGEKCCDLPVGSKVTLGNNCTRGLNNKNFCAVTSVTTAAGKTYNFQDHGFIDLTYGGSWLNVGSILIRKA